MKIADTFTFKADQQVVWELLMNPDIIAKALPGVDRLVPIEGETNAWRATAKIAIASVSGMYSGTVRMTDLVPPDHYQLTVGGEGQASIINGSALMTLSFDPETNVTLLSWSADASISGRLAGVGQRLVSVAAAMLAKQFFRALARQLPNADTPEPSSEEAKGAVENT